MMDHSPLFLKFRTIAFLILTLVCFVWIILLSVVVTLRWGTLDTSEHSLLILFIVADSLTVIILPILILREFRTWLDGARLLLLLMIQIGVVAVFTAWYPTFTCATSSVDDRGVCQLLNMYILIAGWVPVALLLAYSCCLAYYTYRIRSLPPSIVTKHSSDGYALGDEEEILGLKIDSRRGTLPMMEPSLNTPLSISIDRTIHLVHLSSDGSSPIRPSPGSRRPSMEPAARSGHLSVDGSRPSTKPNGSRKLTLEKAMLPGHASGSSGSTGSRRPSMEPAVWPGHLSVDGSRPSTGPNGARRLTLETSMRPGHGSRDGSQSTESPSSTDSRRPSLEPSSTVSLHPGRLNVAVDAGSRRPSQVSMLTPVAPIVGQASAPSPLQVSPGPRATDSAGAGVGAGPLREKIRKHESGRLSKARLPAWYF